jgi:hypothetical protein
MDEGDKEAGQSAIVPERASGENRHPIFAACGRHSFRRIVVFWKPPKLSMWIYFGLFRIDPRIDPSY